MSQARDEELDNDGDKDDTADGADNGDGPVMLLMMLMVMRVCCPYWSRRPCCEVDDRANQSNDVAAAADDDDDRGDDGELAPRAPELAEAFPGTLNFRSLDLCGPKRGDPCHTRQDDIASPTSAAAAAARLGQPTLKRTWSYEVAKEPLWTAGFLVDIWEGRGFWSCRCSARRASLALRFQGEHGHVPNCLGPRY